MISSVISALYYNSEIKKLNHLLEIGFMLLNINGPTGYCQRKA